MKKIILPVKIALLITLSLAFLSCESEDNETLGKKAAREFCECLDDYSSSECEDKLKSKYKESEYISDAFIDAFNEEGKSCGIKASKWEK